MPVRFVSLGRSGLKLSNLCLGCYNFGWRTEGDEAVRLIHQALDSGMNFLDTADYYSGGESEAIVGRAVKGRREQVIIATKVGESVGTGPNDRGASRYRIMRQVEGSLRRLQTDYIDLYWVHRPDPGTPLEETLRAMDDLVRSGKVRYVGLSNFAAWQVMEALWVAERLGLDPVVGLQPWYCMIRREIESDLVPLAQRYGLGIVPYGALAFSLLTGKYKLGEPFPEDTRGSAKGWPQENPVFRRDWERAMQVVQQIRQHGLEPTQAAIAWVMAQPGITSTIIGPRTAAHLDDNLKAADLTLPPDLLSLKGGGAV